RRHTRFSRDWSSDVCSSDLLRYKQKKIKPGSVRRHIRYLFIAYGFLTFFNRQRIPLDSVTFYKDNVSQEIFDAYRRFPLDEVNRSEERCVGKVYRSIH